MPAEKNHAEFKVITPMIENKKVATKNEVKSLSKAFWALELSSLKINPKSEAALMGVKIQFKTNPKIK